MAQKLLLIPTLVLGLLLQGAAAQAEMPCAQEQTHQATAASQGTGVTGHAHHAMQDETPGKSHHETHNNPPPAMHEAADAHAQMPCCDIGEAADCSMSGCASATPAMTMMSSVEMVSHSREAAAQAIDWLAPYASPTDGIFRPPIA